MVNTKKINRSVFGFDAAANDNVLVGTAWATAPAWLRTEALRKATAPKARKGQQFRGVVFNAKRGE